MKKRHIYFYNFLRPLVILFTKLKFNYHYKKAENLPDNYIVLSNHVTDYDMLFVANCFRPLTTTPEDTITVMREIEAACGIKFTGIVNNSNLGNETTSDDVIMSLEYIKKISDSTGLPVVMNCVKADLYGQLLGKVANLFSLTLQTKYFDINTGGI